MIVKNYNKTTFHKLKKLFPGEDFGFKPEHSLTYGIKELIKGFQIIKKSAYGNI